MNTAQKLRDEIAGIGYAAIMDDYVFSDVFASPPRDRSVTLAAFTHSPPSYRNAAFGVVANLDRRTPDQIASETKALGAPLLFVIEGQDVTVWQVFSDQSPRPIARAHQDQLPALFASQRDRWNPQRIQRAKSLGSSVSEYQLDFVDVGLLPAIEGVLEPKLDRLLSRTLAEAQGADSRNDGKRLLQAVFRFLAAKILQDKSHELSTKWHYSDYASVLSAISGYYSLPLLVVAPKSAEAESFEIAWRNLRAGINLQNISADNLAFVYENTLVTQEMRREFGTHSTPRQVAEYVVSRLELHSLSLNDLRVYEPFAGAAVFLTSAMRHIRELLPTEWSDLQRHEFLVGRLSGDDREEFACEVAVLSLILADYPNRNGWHIRQADLFASGVLDARVKANNVILCNPPYERFSAADRLHYPEAAQWQFKPEFVLDRALRSNPDALGFVMPRTFIMERQYKDQRKRIETQYEDVEIVELPDRVFDVSKIETSLLIAKHRRKTSSNRITLRLATVSDDDRRRFLRSGNVTSRRQLDRVIGDPPAGDLWVSSLDALWRYLGRNQRMGALVEVHLGARWKYPQQRAARLDKAGEGDIAGLLGVEDLFPFHVGRARWLDMSPENLTHAKNRQWQRPKVIINRVRRRRGAWRLVAIPDFSGLAFSQQFLGLWPKVPHTDDDLWALAAILNGPVANAYLHSHSPSSSFRFDPVQQIPVPKLLPQKAAALAREYADHLQRDLQTDRESELSDLLSLIDAAVLEAYDLPPRLERRLLEFFRGAARPVPHPWEFWFPQDHQSFTPLQEYLAQGYSRLGGNWITDVFQPLPEKEAGFLREALDRQRD